MIRKIIKIDEEKCNGCGLCAKACHEGAIEMVDGKAKLIKDDYCDGLGDCLPACPTAAITFEEREAAAYDEAAVKARMQKMAKTHSHENHSGSGSPLPCGCPGSNARAFKRTETESARTSSGGTCKAPSGNSLGTSSNDSGETSSDGSGRTSSGNPLGTSSGGLPEIISKLSQWPVQIKLVPVNAPYFENANLLVAADCAAYAYGNFHNEFMKNKITLIGCPKLDEGDYAEKLTTIIKENDIKSVTVARMEVPCCGGIENAVKTALQNSGKMIPWQIVTISTDGRILEN